MLRSSPSGWGVFAALVFVLATCAGGSAGAEGRSVSERLPDAEVERRTAFIEERLDRHRTHARIWHWGWTAVNGGAAIGLGIAGALSDEKVDRVTFFSQSALATLGLVDLYLLRPVRARNGADPIRALPGATPAERRARLERAEDLLRQGARRPGGRMHLWPHLGNVLLNAAVGVGVWRAGSAKDGLISGISSALVGEFYLFSEPHGWREDLEAYQQYKAGPRKRSGTWSLVSTGRGVAIRYDF